MEWLTPTWLQGGALGLAAIVAGLFARFAHYVLQSSAEREKVFFETMQRQQDQFDALMEKQNEKFERLAGAFDRMTGALVDVVDRLEDIEAKVGVVRSKRNRNLSQ